ncbi:hypothetical protein CFO_g3415 [Ceratocystis platani]|uniref:F-box domain-containing protein n=1 Tax=Ceratocystis fimbriata f. sp. platani TaxID=88771 RepID=A0A0F8B041_CERFI|nr:hypothetical protein CFO_g3415 [Ceratocystis platani]
MSGPGEASFSLSLLHLPPEIITRILVFVQLPKDLIAVSMSCRAMDAIVRQHESWIVSHVISNIFHPTVLPAALLVQKARQLPHISEDPQGAAARQFLQKYLVGHPEDGLISASEVRTLSDLQALIPLHSVVKSFAGTFVGHCMQRKNEDYLAGWNTSALFSPDHMPTESEWTRIERSLYHYELFCVLFGHDPAETFTGRSTLQREFRSCFAPWELEQIASVFDVLRVDVYRAFRDVARHDITYGFHMVEYDKRHSPWMRHVIETGLEFMYDVVTAADFTQRRAILQRQHDGDSIPRSCSFWPICWELPNNALLHGHDFAPFSHRNMEMTPAWMPEEDSGPEEVWRWVCRTGSTSNNNVPLSPFKRWILRHQGYAFWDSWRVKDVGILKQAFREPFFQESHFHVREQLALEGLPNTEAYTSRMVGSWHARKLIFMEGGRGYWDFADTKKIEWGYPSVPRSREHMMMANEGK